MIVLEPANLPPSHCAPILSNPWNYSEAFSRNRGLITNAEQEVLRNSHIAIAGLGGVGGLHLITLARLGVGRFTIADPDTFEAANTNRQYGSTCSSRGKSKVEIMAKAAQDINPDIEINSLHDHVNRSNVDKFLGDSDVFVDAIDLYAVDARRAVFSAAAAKGIPGVTAGPMGFSTCWLTFLPTSMPFDRYFDLRNSMTPIQKVVAFLMGLCPRMLPLRYMDRQHADPIRGRAPSVSAGCQLATGVMAAEVTKLLLGRGPIRPAPYYQIFDAYLGRYASGTLRGGNRHLWQRIKRKWLERDWKRRFSSFDRSSSDHS